MDGGHEIRIFRIGSAKILLQELKILANLERATGMVLMQYCIELPANWQN